MAAVLERCNVFLSGRYAGGGVAEPLVLEAGGGSFSHFRLPPGSRLLSLDIELGQLRKNQAARYRLQGDLHRLPIRPGSVDMVICFNVIEHLEDPEAALGQLVAAMRHGGTLVLGCPDRASLKGLVTRLTPVGFHRWYYRRVVGKQDRGDGHFDVFPTPFRAVVSAARLPAFLEALGLRIVYFDHYDGARQYGITTGSFKRRLVAAPFYLAAALGRWLSLGRWQAERSDVLLVAEKPSGMEPG